MVLFITASVGPAVGALIVTEASKYPTNIKQVCVQHCLLTKCCNVTPGNVYITLTQMSAFT